MRTRNFRDARTGRQIMKYKLKLFDNIAMDYRLKNYNKVYALLLEENSMEFLP